MSHETVGSLLAVIANSINDAIRIMIFADKRAWGPDEFEQLRLLEETLDDAKRDFQELPMLVNGRFYYENDRNADTLSDLRNLRTRFEQHSRTFKEWTRDGGPINPLWAVETLALKKELHRAQCRAARRIYSDTETETLSRCLGGLQVFRAQHQANRNNQGAGSRSNVDEEARKLALACNQTGHFERFGEHDIAFVCDFCDGFLVWEDLQTMPNSRRQQQQATARPTTTTMTTSARTGSALPITSATPLSPGLHHPASPPTTNSTTNPAPNPNPHMLWSAQAQSHVTQNPKVIVFAPLAIANHLPPEPGEWVAGIMCPYCEEYYYEEPGDDEVERVRYIQDERGFDGVERLREHLEVPTSR
ncbi:hypothetical protein F4778DRAFT_771185 [Xylariomycetidae sp. FL2044]|nr:hypothetical protein F4778DRAFT_771185 [Xylariomycetidae sp. FL2044]